MEGREELKLLPVSKKLQHTWRDTDGKGNYSELEWEWRKDGSVPSADPDTGDGKVQKVYQEVRAAIKLGESVFPRGAAKTDKSMQDIEENNRMLRGDSKDEDEYDVAFLARDVADGLDEEWKRPMHWAGFLVVGAATRLPSPEGVGDQRV